jgi:hypothetical protein
MVTSIDEFETILKKPDINLDLVIRDVIRGGNLEVVEYAYNKFHSNNKHVTLLSYIRMAIAYKQAHVMMWVMQHRDFRPSFPEIGGLVWQINKEDDVECMTAIIGFPEYCISKTFIANGAMVLGSVNILRMMCKRGEVKLWAFTRERNVRELIQVYHEYQIPGDYQSACKEGMCVLCKVEELKKLWEMDIDEFTNSFQWLPREITLDVYELL